MPGICLSALLGVLTAEQRRSAGTDSKRLEAAFHWGEKIVLLLRGWLSETPLEQSKGLALLPQQEKYTLEEDFPNRALQFFPSSQRATEDNLRGCWELHYYLKHRSP